MYTPPVRAACYYARCMPERLLYYGKWAAIGSVFGTAFLHAWLWWLVLPALVLSVISAEAAPSPKQAFIGGAVAGSVKMLFVMNWLWTMGFGDLLRMSSFFALVFAIAFVWLGTSLSMGIPFGMFTLTAHKLKRVRSRYVFLPLAVVASEMIGSVCFGLFTLGATSALVSLDFTFGYLGYPLAHHQWLGMAAIVGGVYALSAFAVVVSLLGVQLCRQAAAWSATHRFALGGVLLLSIASGYVVPLAHSGDTRVGAVYTFYTANNEAAKQARINEQNSIRFAVREGLLAGADYVVLPETVSVFNDHADAKPILTFLHEYSDKPVVLIDSFVEGQAGQSANVAAAIYDSGSDTSHTVHKQYLLPYGEYFPYHMSLLFKLAGITSEKVLENRIVYKEGDASPVETPAVWPRVLFCSENISPFRAFARTREREVPFIAHMVSHGWFNDPDTLWNQLDMMLKTNARFAGVPLVQAGNNTPPRAFDRYGRPIVPEVVYTSDTVVTLMFSI